jgi:NAD+ diphosphatase
MGAQNAAYVAAQRTEPPLAGRGHDRAAHRRTDPEWLARAWERARVLVYDPQSGRALVVAGEDDPPALHLLSSADAPPGDRLFLGEDAAGTPYFVVAGVLPELADARAVTLREVGHLLADEQAALLVSAAALVQWHAAHAYSPRTGESTTVGDGGWTRLTPDGVQMFPRTDPAVIVVVHDGVAGEQGRCLLAHNASWVSPNWTRRYSCLAGFVEPGESAEAAVIREVAEEVGVAVRDVTYVASQPWPFPASLMLGFFAIGDPEAPIVVDQAEIADARWFTRTEIRAMLDDGGAGSALPMGASIALFLVVRWLNA